MDEHRILAQQAGLITRAQAMKSGLSASTITRRMESREWFAVFPGVYRHCGALVSNELMVEGAMLWLPDATLSGSWAAWWHRLRGEPTGPVSVTVPRASAARSRDTVAVRRRRLDPADVVTVRGVPVVTRALAALENACLSDGQDVVDRALQKFVSPVELAMTLDRMTGSLGAPEARRSVELVRPGGVSPPERELRKALHRAGLDMFTPALAVSACGARYVVDFGVAGLKLAVEVDGVAPHSAPAQFHRDRKRQNDLIRAGWTVLRYTPQQLRHNIEAIVAEIRATVESLRQETVGLGW